MKIIGSPIILSETVNEKKIMFRERRGRASFPKLATKTTDRSVCVIDSHG